MIPCESEELPVQLPVQREYSAPRVPGMTAFSTTVIFRPFAHLRDQADSVCLPSRAAEATRPSLTSAEERGKIELVAKRILRWSSGTFGCTMVVAGGRNVQ
ncbi:hypothetical protein GCM10010350_75510 [Streptomyces galilaeus]|nr:hypothetical protein GCM10010350_75510 [Streptomyces galilaeus]